MCLGVRFFVELECFLSPLGLQKSVSCPAPQLVPRWFFLEAWIPPCPPGPRSPPGVVFPQPPRWGGPHSAKSAARPPPPRSDPPSQAVFALRAGNCRSSLCLAKTRESTVPPTSPVPARMEPPCYLPPWGIPRLAVLECLPPPRLVAPRSTPRGSQPCVEKEIIVPPGCLVFALQRRSPPCTRFWSRFERRGKAPAPPLRAVPQTQVKNPVRNCRRAPLAEEMPVPRGSTR